RSSNRLPRRRTIPRLHPAPPDARNRPDPPDPRPPDRHRPPRRRRHRIWREVTHARLGSTLPPRLAPRLPAPRPAPLPRPLDAAAAGAGEAAGKATGGPHPRPLSNNVGEGPEMRPARLTPFALDGARAAWYH